MKDQFGDREFPVDLDLGNGYLLHFLSWSPNRELNPQFDGIPDIEKAAALILHPLVDDKACEKCAWRGDGMCIGAVTLDDPNSPHKFEGRTGWQVESWEPLTLSPSILCHCGDHGFIRGGKWVKA